MTEHRDKDRSPIHFKHQMIGKLCQVAASPRIVEPMKFRRPFLYSPNPCFERGEKPVACGVGPLIVVGENLPKIPSNQRVKNHLHLVRDARNSSMNSSSAIPSTSPDLSSSPRWIASSRLSPSESLGSAPSRLSRISTARSARSSTPSFSASAPISAIFIHEPYHAGRNRQYEYPLRDSAFRSLHPA